MLLYFYMCNHRNGIPQSKRYGFVEFKDHAHALACVRELSHSHDFLQYLPALQREMLASPQSSAPTAASDPTGGGKLLVEFCLENQRKVQVLKKRTENNESFKKQKTQESIPNFNKQELTTKSTSRSVVEAATFSSKQKVDESSYEMMDEDISQNGTETEVEVEPTEGKKRRDSRQQLKKASSKVKRKKIVSKRKENEKKRKESKKLTKK